MPQFNIKQSKGLTQGSVLFLGANGIVTENNSQFYWDISNSRLAIGTPSFFGTEKLRVVGSQRIDGDLFVTGSFSVLGSASVIYTQNLSIQDPIILLASTQSGSPVLDSGFFINRGTGATYAFIWDESDDKFAVIQTNDSSSAIGNVSISSGAELRALRYNFFDTGAPSTAAAPYIYAPSGGSMAINASGTFFFYVPQIASSGQSTSWDVGANELQFQGGSGTTLRHFRIGVNDAGNNIPTFTLQSQSTGASSFFRTGLSFSHKSNVTQNDVLERGFVIEVRDSGTYSGTAVGLVVDLTGVTNSNRIRKSIRLVDGSQANGYILVSDSNGYASWTSSSNVVNISANNGLTYSGGYVQLGGSLVRDTLISNATWSFTMSSTSVIDLTSTSGALQISRLGASSTETTFEMYDFGGGMGYCSIKLYNTQQSGGDGSTNNQMIVRDDQQLKGLVYAGNYTSNFTTYSLITKGYVDAIVGTATGVTGSGTANYVPYWVTPTQLSSVSSIRDSGTAVGIGTQSNGLYMVNVQGDVNILGTLYATSKSFEIEHPLDPSKRLTYGSLEGPEYGVYFRGRLQNSNIIYLPDYWTGLVDESSISVNVTSIGLYQRLFVDKIENNKVYIGSDNSGSPNCYYTVYAERKDIPKIIVE